MHKQRLLDNAEKIHTTEMGVARISGNLGIEGGVVEYCILKVKSSDSEVSKKGKNYYVETDDEIITINSSSFTIITAHKKK